jgi:protein-S-isoprenylcysteine O-methyltransferase Ste14
MTPIRRAKAGKNCGEIMTLERIIQWLGGLFAFTVLGLLLFGVWRGTKRKAGRTIGLKGSWLLSPWAYLVVSALFFGLAYLGWIPLPWKVSRSTREWMLVIGSLLYFPGLSLVLWGRLALGKNYFVSTGLSAQLFTGHQLVTSGPYAIVRHPIYTGLLLAAWGSLLIYATWTTAYFAVFAPAVLMRSRREEAALSEEFGEQWQEYYKRVPAFVPRLRKKR